MSGVVGLSYQVFLLQRDTMFGNFTMYHFCIENSASRRYGVEDEVREQEGL